MTIFIILAVAFVLICVFIAWLKLSKPHVKKEYLYKQKDFFMTRAEHECYDALVTAVGDKYFIFPQVRLPSIVDSRVVGQYWKAAFSHISQKSVDFVLCDKAYISPKLAIELDDRSHERTDRQSRDVEVERILKDAGLPLLRLENRGRFDSNELTRKIDETFRN